MTNSLVDCHVVKETLYNARCLDTDISEEVNAYQRLRYDYFVSKKGWIAPHPSKAACETDYYDYYAKHLAVFQNDHSPVSEDISEGSAATLVASDIASIRAYLRVLLWTAPCGFMLDHEFRCLLSDLEYASLHRENAVELSRLVIARGACTKPSGNSCSIERPPHVVELLLKLLYHLSLEEQIEHYYIVVEKHWLSAFTRRFHISFKVIGREYTFPDGTITVAAHATRTDLEQAVAAKDPQKFLWYQQRRLVSS